MDLEDDLKFAFKGVRKNVKEHIYNITQVWC